MFQRGDVVIFRPKEYIKDEFYPKYGDLNIGIVSDVVKSNFVLVGNNATEHKQELLHLRVTGGFRPTLRYPDKLNSSINCAHDCTSASFGWYHARRESLVNQITVFKTQNDVNIDFGHSLSSHITDLDIKFAPLDTDESDIQGLYIRFVETDAHMHKPSIFHNKIEKAIGSFTAHWNSSILWKALKRWQDKVVLRLARKRDASIIVQKNVRRYFERNTLIKQSWWTKWWGVQKEFWFEYVDPKSEGSCYNIKGTQLYFSTKFAADRWSNQLKLNMNKLAVYAVKSVHNRQKAALKEWKQTVLRQKSEAGLMTLEDLSSSLSGGNTASFHNENMHQ